MAVKSEDGCWMLESQGKLTSQLAAAILGARQVCHFVLWMHGIILMNQTATCFCWGVPRFPKPSSAKFEEHHFSKLFAPILELPSQWWVAVITIYRVITNLCVPCRRIFSWPSAKALELHGVSSLEAEAAVVKARFSHGQIQGWEQGWCLWVSEDWYPWYADLISLACDEN